MSRRLFVILFWPLLGAWALWLLYATHVFAQALVAPQAAYTSSDPVRPDAIGLATPDGRFAVSKADNCATAGIGPGMNVMLWQLEGYTGIGVIAPLIDGHIVVSSRDDQGNIIDRMCGVRFEQLMDSTPCFVNAEGHCDVALEQ